MSPPERKHPNIAIAGTPGTGKTTLAQRLAASDANLKVLDLGAEAEARKCRQGYDAELKSWIIDEDKVCGPSNGNLRPLG